MWIYCSHYLYRDYKFLTFSFNICKLWNLLLMTLYSKSRTYKGYLAFVCLPFNTIFVIYVCDPLITEYICMVHMYVHDVHMSGEGWQAGKWLGEGGDSRHSQFVSSKYRYFYIYSYILTRRKFWFSTCFAFFSICWEYIWRQEQQKQSFCFSKASAHNLCDKQIQM